MKPRIVFIHGNQTSHWSSAWAPWLKGELEKLGYPTWFETMPDSIIARAEYWLPFMADHIKIGPNDVIVGWSSGAVAAMRYAQDHQIRGSVLVSPCYTDTGDELEKQSGYYEQPWNWEAVKANQADIGLFYGDDDPYISQTEFEFIGQNLDAKINKIAGGKHFIEQNSFPELLTYIKQMY